MFNLTNITNWLNENNATELGSIKKEISYIDSLAISQNLDKGGWKTQDKT